MGRSVGERTRSAGSEQVSTGTWLRSVESHRGATASEFREHEQHCTKQVPRSALPSAQRAPGETLQRRMREPREPPGKQRSQDNRVRWGRIVLTRGVLADDRRKICFPQPAHRTSDTLHIAPSLHFAARLSRNVLGYNVARCASCTKQRCACHVCPTLRDRTSGWATRRSPHVLRSQCRAEHTTAC